MQEENLVKLVKRLRREGHVILPTFDSVVEIERVTMQHSIETDTVGLTVEWRERFSNNGLRTNQFDVPADIFYEFASAKDGGEIVVPSGVSGTLGVNAVNVVLRLIEIGKLTLPGLGHRNQYALDKVTVQMLEDEKLSFHIQYHNFTDRMTRIYSATFTQEELRQSGVLEQPEMRSDILATNPNEISRARRLAEEAQQEVARLRRVAERCNEEARQWRTHAETEQKHAREAQEFIIKQTSTIKALQAELSEAIARLAVHEGEIRATSRMLRKR